MESFNKNSQDTNPLQIMYAGIQENFDSDTSLLAEIQRVNQKDLLVAGTVMRALDTIQSDDIPDPSAARYVVYEQTGVSIDGSETRQIGIRIKQFMGDQENNIQRVVSDGFKGAEVLQLGFTDEDATLLMLKLPA